MFFHSHNRFITLSVNLKEKNYALKSWRNNQLLIPYLSSSANPDIHPESLALFVVLKLKKMNLNSYNNFYILLFKKTNLGFALGFVITVVISKNIGLDELEIVKFGFFKTLLSAAHLTTE